MKIARHFTAGYLPPSFCQVPKGRPNGCAPLSELLLQPSFRDLWLFGTATLALKCQAILGSPSGTFPKSLTQFLIALAAKAILRGVARNRESLVFPSSARAVVQGTSGCLAAPGSLIGKWRAD
jgi:hypothetical protein